MISTRTLSIREILRQENMSTLSPMIVRCMRVALIPCRVAPLANKMYHPRRVPVSRYEKPHTYLPTRD
jgi:hypothetical protein